MYHILEDLLELSQKSDKIIETALIEHDLDEKFLYAKNIIQQIMNGNFPKYDHYPKAEKKKNGKKIMFRQSYSIKFQNKSHLFMTNSLSPANQNSVSNDSGVVFVSPFDTEENVTLKNKIKGKEFEESDEGRIPQKEDSSKCETIMRENYHDVTFVVDNNVMCSSEKSIDTVMCKEKERNALNQTAITNEIGDQDGKEILNITPKIRKSSLNFEDDLHVKRRTRSVTKSYSKKGISLDGSFEKLDNALANECILNKTYVINSASSGNKAEDISNRTYTISSTSSEEHNRCTVILGDSSEDAEVVTFSPIFFSNDEEELREEDDKNVNDNIDEKCLSTEMLTSVQVKSSNAAGIKNHDGPNKCPISSSNLDKRKISNNSSSDEIISEIKKAALLRKTKIKRLRRGQFQTNFASVCRKQIKEKVSRPATPNEFTTDYNRQSLKDRAEEKRKHREIRAQKTKERREFLQRKKEERNRLTEQRLKERLEQHEKMLKEKVNKFKRKLRYQQQRNTRQYHSSTSISSKGSSEDRAKDNDIELSVQENSQLPSKPDNSYEKSLKKPKLISLVGKTGQIPRTFEKYDSVVNCNTKTADFPAYADVTESEKAKPEPECEKNIHIEGSQQSECIIAPDSFKKIIPHCSSKIKRTLCYFDESDIVKSNQKQSKKDTLNKMDNEINQFKQNEDFLLLSEEMSSKEDMIQTSCFLRSSPKDYSSNNASISSETQKLQNTVILQPHEMTTLSSENEICGCNYSCCFNSSKPKSNQKMNSKTLAKSRISVQVVRKKRRLNDFNKGAANKKNVKKTLKKKNVSSYKISDMHENSFDETKVDHSKIPSWAKGLYLKQALIQQYYEPPDVEKIFGTVPHEPIDLGTIFQMDKPEYHRRTSSEKWSSTETPS